MMEWTVGLSLCALGGALGGYGWTHQRLGLCALGALLVCGGILL